MTRKLLVSSLYFLTLSLNALESPHYLNLPLPSGTPQKFWPKIFDSLGNKTPTNPEFSPDFRYFFFTSVDDSEKNNPKLSIMYSKNNAGIWSNPEEASFLKYQNHSPFNMAEPFFSKDGQTLYFQSNRPPGSPLWKVQPFASQLKADRFSAPRHIKISDVESVFFPFPAANGDIYFCTNRANGLGRSDLYRAEKDSQGNYSRVENLGAPLNSAFTEWDPYLSPDEKYLLFISDRPGGYGKADIYLSARSSNGTWGEPMNLGPEINTAHTETAAKLSPDGQFLFFQRIINHQEIIFWVDFKKLLKAQNILTNKVE